MTLRIISPGFVRLSLYAMRLQRAFEVIQQKFTWDRVLGLCGMTAPDPKKHKARSVKWNLKL
jgi:hypothetical protein